MRVPNKDTVTFCKNRHVSMELIVQRVDLWILYLRMRNAREVKIWRPPLPTPLIRAPERNPAARKSWSNSPLVELVYRRFVTWRMAIGLRLLKINLWYMWTEFRNAMQWCTVNVQWTAVQMCNTEQQYLFRKWKSKTQTTLNIYFSL